MYPHLYIEAHALPGTSWEQALTEARAMAQKLRAGVELHWQDTIITLLPNSTRADVERTLAALTAPERAE